MLQVCPIGTVMTSSFATRIARLNMDSAYSPCSTDAARVEARIVYLAGTSCRARVLSPCIVGTSQTHNLCRRQLLPRCKLHTTDNFRPGRDFQCRRARRKFPEQEARSSYLPPSDPLVQIRTPEFYSQSCVRRIIRSNRQLPARVSRTSPQARIRRPHRTKRYGHSDPKDAQPAPGRSYRHHTAHILSRNAPFTGTRS
jgi:hypothetical protein